MFSAQQFSSELMKVEERLKKLETVMTLESMVKKGVDRVTMGWDGELLVVSGIRFKEMADANAPNNCLYYSTTANKLVYKDGGGVVNNLY